jgi:hypothetical protein
VSLQVAASAAGSAVLPASDWPSVPSLLSRSPNATAQAVMRIEENELQEASSPGVPTRLSDDFRIHSKSYPLDAVSAAHRHSADYARMPTGRACAAPRRSRPSRARPSGSGSTPAAVGRPATRRDGSCSPAWAPTRLPAPAANAALKKESRIRACPPNGPSPYPQPSSPRRTTTERTRKVSPALDAALEPRSARLSGAVPISDWLLSRTIASYSSGTPRSKVSILGVSQTPPDAKGN